MVTILPPDFEDMSRLASKIGRLSTQELDLKDTIATMESESIRTAIKEAGEKKPPSMELLKLTVKHTGINGEILPLRAELSKVSGELEESKRLFEVYRAIVSIYQTESSNKRAGLI